MSSQAHAEQKPLQFTAEQTAELVRLKQYFPFRIVWGALNDSGEFVSGADTTRRRLNSYLRKGYTAAILTGGAA